MEYTLQEIRDGTGFGQGARFVLVEPECDHTWRLTESGYVRTWSTEIHDDGTIVAIYAGSEDWSDDGDGDMYLQCWHCLETKPLPDGADIIYS